MIRLQDIDLNLLIVFQQLFETRRISEAARKLGRSQPTVSNALRRLRRAFDDPLFVRTSEGMSPTPFAQQLAKPITIALSNISNAVNHREYFDPRISRRRFTIAATELGEIDLIPLLANKCNSAAPHIQISTVRASSISLDLIRDLEAGRIDLALGAFENVSGSLHRQRLFRQSYVTMFRAKHELGQGEVNLKSFLSARHLFVTNRSGADQRVNRCLQRAGIMQTVTLEVPYFTAVPYLIQATDCVATVPKRFAEAAAAPFGLEFITPPIKMPILTISAWWHPRFHQDKGNKWLRDLTIELFSS
jgi:DNA-binding transcriptional LysR family regulator